MSGKGSNRPEEPKKVTVGGDYVDGNQTNVAGNQINYSTEYGHIVITNPNPSISARERRNRQNLLNVVKHNWIESVLKPSINQDIYINLGLEYRPGPLRVRQEIIPKNKPVPEDKTILDLFNESGRNLLILGEPASGKTTLLLKLAEQLIQIAQQNEFEPLPIVLNLSYWEYDRKNFIDWVTDEIYLAYGISTAKTLRWLQEEQIILLLDALDEVGKQYRNECVDQINKFKKNNPIQMVLTSRKGHYKKLKKKLNVSLAVSVQSLNSFQIQNYLSQFDQNGEVLMQYINTDFAWMTLAKSPFFLSLLPISFVGSIQTAPKLKWNEVALKKQLFDDYITRVFNLRPLKTKKYDKNQALQWLINLAHGMKNHNQSVFYIETLQPTWLSNKLYKRYQWIARLVVLVVALLNVLLIAWLIGKVGLGLDGGPLGWMSNRVFDISIIIFFVSLATGFSGRLIFWLNLDKIKLREHRIWLRPQFSRFLNTVIWKFVTGSIFGFIFGMFLNEAFKQLLSLEARLAPSLGLSFGISFGLIGGVRSLLKTAESRKRQIPNIGIQATLLNTIIFSLAFGMIGGLGGLIG
nr:NACHT domain-containing protein [Ardenticatenaceae bacterium]